ncbi:MAG: hypothetical protein ABI758_00155 [Candidatus Woesebacteria bacterium]
MMSKKTIVRYTFWSIKFVVAVIIAGVLLRGLLESIFLPDRTATDYSFIKKDLQTPGFTGYSTSQVLREQPFQIVALSDMAVGLMNLDTVKRVPRAELLPLIEEVKRRALTPYVSTYGSLTPDTDFTTGGIDGLYLSHLNLIFGIDQYLHSSKTADPLHTAITKTLHERSLSEPDFHVPSFRNGDKWPADQSVTLLSLYVYDQANGTTYSKEPIEKWFSFMNEKMVDPETGLYKPSIASRWYMDIPRGTAQSWMIFYMAQFAPDQAQRVYSLYREHMWKEFLGIGGFREWPIGRGGRMNIDSGPIVFDIGSAATALGLGPARLLHDTTHIVMITRLFSLLGIPHYAPLIGKAILFSGETATPWFTDTKAQGYDVVPQFPLFLYALYLLFTVVVCATILFFDMILSYGIKKIIRFFSRNRKKTEHF